MKWLALAAALLISNLSVNAQTVRFVVPFAPGGAADVVARILAEQLKTADRTFVVENHGGAGGMIGSARVAEAAPDGKTILIATLGTHIMGPSTKDPRTMSYDPASAFEPVVLIGSVPSLLVAKPGFPAGLGLRELITLAKNAEADKKPMSYGSAGPGTSMNVAMEMLKAAAGVDITHIQYKGAGPAITDLLGNHIDMLVADITILVPKLTTGMRPIALLSTERSSLARDIPTTTELGFPNLIMESWYGILVPKGVPVAVRDALERDILRAMQAPAVINKFSAFGIRNPGNAAQFSARLQQDQREWPAIVRKLKIQAE